MEKAVKYCDIITNSIILQNIVDMSDIIHQLTEEGHDIREDDIAFLSPYMTEHIKRFGDYFIDIGQRSNQITEGAKRLDSYTGAFTHWSPSPIQCEFMPSKIVINSSISPGPYFFDGIKKLP